MLLIDGPASSVLSLAFSACGHFLLSGHSNGAIRLLNGAGDELHQFGSEGSQPRYDVQFGPTETEIFASNRHEFQQFINQAVTGHEVGKGFPDSETLSLQALSDKILAVGIGHPSQSRAGRFLLYDLARRNVLQPSFREPDGVRGVATHPGSKSVAWITSGRLWSYWTITKADRKQYPLKSPARAISIHPDGHTVGIATNWEVLLWKVGDMRESRVLKGHKGIVTTLAFSPDGRWLCSGSWDGTVRLWELSTGQERACFRWPIGRVQTLVYAPDGLRMAAAGDLGQIVIWDTD